MGMSWRDRIAYRLERYSWLHWLLVRADGVTPHTGRRRYVNRINGHVLVR